MSQMSGAAIAKWITVFWEICSKKSTGLQGNTLSGHRMTTRFALRSPAFGWHIVLWAFTVLWIFELLNKLGVWLNGEAIIILTRGVGEQLTFRLAIMSSWWSVWEACSLTVGIPVPKICCWSFGSTAATFSRWVYLFVCETQSMGFKWKHASFSSSIIILVTAFLC